MKYKITGNIHIYPGQSYINKHLIQPSLDTRIPSYEALREMLSLYNSTSGVPYARNINRGQEGAFLFINNYDIKLKIVPHRHSVWELKFVSAANSYGFIKNDYWNRLHIYADAWVLIDEPDACPAGAKNHASEIIDQLEKQKTRSHSCMLEQPSPPSSNLAHLSNDPKKVKSNNQHTYDTLNCEDRDFLGHLKDIIGKEQEIAQKEAQSKAPVATFTYSHVDAVVHAHSPGTSTYTFTTPDPPDHSEYKYGYIECASPLWGTIQRSNQNQVVIKFKEIVPYEHIPRQGKWHPSVDSHFPSKAKLEAVDTLEKTSVGQNRLLPLVARGQVPEPLTPTVKAISLPKTPLDGTQQTALHKAVSNLPLVLLHGPPGTGKTTTISYIVRTLLAQGQRVLVTSHANKAVDNVLERLDYQPGIIRVSSDEQKVSEKVLDLSPRQQAERLRGLMLQHAEMKVTQLAPWLDAQPDMQLVDLAQTYQALDAAEASLVKAHKRMTHVRKQVERIHQREIQHLQGQLRSDQETTRQIKQQLDAINTQLSRPTKSMGFMFRIIDTLMRSWHNFRRRRLLSKKKLLSGQVERATYRLHYHQHQLSDAPTKSERFISAQDEATKASSHIEQATTKAAHLLTLMGEYMQGMVINWNPSVPVGQQKRCQHIEGLRLETNRLRAHAKLMQSWKQALTQAGHKLDHEMIRGASVVGSTCLSISSPRHNLSDQMFDVVIVDEAGQIPTSLALIPLLRGKRAILVGDHRQLPPVENRDVLTALSNGSSVTPQISDLISKSLFERLYPLIPADNKLMLDCQRRTPKIIADIVSKHFYDGHLRSDVQHATSECPIFIIDTSDDEYRFETIVTKGEDQNPKKTYTNRLESKIIVSLIRYYHNIGREFAAISPYKEQVHLISSMVVDLMGTQSTSDNIGTVDAFQGQERDTIIYGFTRSNREDQIGFLNELRRFNVAITRVKRTLVLVGDFSMLRSVSNKSFKELVNDLYDRGHTVMSKDFPGMLKQFERRNEKQRELQP